MRKWNNWEKETKSAEYQFTHEQVLMEMKNKHKQIKKMEISQHTKYFCEFCGKYSSVEEATEIRNALNNLQWLLVADFVDPLDVKTRAEAPIASPVSTTPKTPQPAPLSCGC
ncbi:hypothetical protein MKW92_018899 [Papaver armeniacum]|nr:hypothetical protein MKW92_018899 [Papaver armeniacum]